MKPNMNRYAAEAQATILGVPRSMWGQFGIRAMPTLKAYSAGRACPSIRGRDGRAFKQSLDSCGGGAPSPSPMPRPSPTPRPSPMPRPTPGHVSWDSKPGYFTMQNNGNYLSNCPSSRGYRRFVPRGSPAPICMKQGGSDMTNEAKQICQSNPSCKTIVTGKCRG